MCKRKGYSYELKEVIELLFHKMTDDPMHNKDIKKVSTLWGTWAPRAQRWVSEAGAWRKDSNVDCCRGAQQHGRAHRDPGSPGPGRAEAGYQPWCVLMTSPFAARSFPLPALLLSRAGRALVGGRSLV